MSKSGVRVPNAPNISISLNSSVKSSDATPTKPSPSATLTTTTTTTSAVDKSFSDEQFLKLWHTYIQQNPKEHLLVNAMRISLPKRVKGDTFSMELANVGLVDVIKNNLGKVLTFLRSSLDNNNITIETTVNENIETVRHLSPTDIITDIMGRNEGVRKLIKSFELGLA